MSSCKQKMSCSQKMGCSHKRKPASKNNKNNSGVFTCPMHPEVRQNGPGDCPKCGMALEPEFVDLNATEDTSEFDSMKLRFWVGLIFTVPIFVISMMEMATSSPILSWLTSTQLAWIQFALSLPVVLWAGAPFFIRGFNSVKSRHLNMFTLISLGVSAAFIYSIVATIFPGVFPAEIKMHGAVPVYFEAATVIIELVLLGQVLELRARGQTNSAIKALLGLAPKTATKIDTNKSENSVAIEQLVIGDKIRIKPGEKAPVDGIVLEGDSFIDESMITGESLPVSKKQGDKVNAGTVNQKGTLVIKATQVGSGTVLSQMIKMVSEAGRSKAPIQRMADRVSGFFVPAVVLVAIITAVCWYFFGPKDNISYALINAVAVLIIACPCALGLATPISIMVSSGKGAQNGVLVKDASSIEQLQSVTTIVVDKTGTLTEGKPKVTEIVTEQENFIANVASLEQSSEHPLAEAIVNFAKEQNISLPKSSNFQSITGKGASAKVGETNVVVGSENYMNQLQVELSSEAKLKADEMRSEGKTVIFAAFENKFAGMIAISDPIKKSAQLALDYLSKKKIHVVMLTGDNHKTAAAIAKILGIKDFMADVLPQNKLDKIRELQSQGEKVAMAGDGINDAPALTAADVGIAMGSGTDVAIESAGLTLLRGDLGGIVKAIKLSKATMRNIHQNLFFAFFYNAIGIPIAAGVLYPLFAVLLNPMIAGAAMSVSSVCVIVNALRLKSLKL